ncbi:MAG: TolC family protein, partial [Melioribacteraceae bacterium]|nr:TolC family protein [Melioribacteraceae bacterium]
PKIKLLESKLKVASARIEQGTNLPDPVLTIGLMNMPTNSFSFTQEPMTGKSIGLTQVIPYPSGLSAAADVKAIDTLVIREEIKNLKNLLRKEVAGLFYELRLAEAEIELNNKRLNLLEQIREVVKSKSEVAEASMQNIIQVKVEITKAEDKIEELVGRKSALTAELNSILLRDEPKIINSGQIEMSEFEEISPFNILKIAQQHQPKLKEIKLSEEKSELMQKQAEYEFYPNFNIGVQYNQREHNHLTGIDYKDFLSVIAGITLPINYGGKKTAKVDEAKYLQMFYKEKYESEMQDLNRSINVITARNSELIKRRELIRNSLLPLAEQSLKIALSDYQVGRIDFVNVINAETEIINVKTDLYRIQTDYDKNLVMLEFLLGTTLADATHNNGDSK